MSPEVLAPGSIFIRHAVSTDTSAITELIAGWAEAGLMLLRDHNEVVCEIDGYVVAERLCKDGQHELVACGALEIVHAGSLAEIRSVAVDSTVRGTGTGAGVVHALLDKARAMGIGQVVLLTKTPGFFARCGFEEIGMHELPPAFVARLTVQDRSLDGRHAMRASG